MKIFKIVFAIFIPLFLITCIITRSTRHVTIRQTFEYIKSSYSLNYKDFTDSLIDIQNRINNYSDKVTNLPETKPNAPLENIWNYILWFANIFAGFFVSIYGLLEGLFKLLYFLLSVIITTFRIILFFFGLITV